MRITDGSHRRNIASIVAFKISKKATENISNLFVSNNLYSNSCPTPFIYRSPLRFLSRDPSISDVRACTLRTPGRA